MNEFSRQNKRSVYLIECYNHGILQYKIGVSKHPAKRLKQHKTSNPGELKILHEFESNWPFKIESLLKRMYKHMLADGEWYNLEQHDVNNFMNVCSKTENNFEIISKNSTLYSDI